LLLHASVKEGWGIVVIEAASQSTPAVVYDVPGLNESVKNNLTGIVLKKNTPEEMASAVIRLTGQKNTYRKYQKNCLKWANELNWDDQVKKSLSMLNKLKK
ncbi:MAG: glycosyltransferase, partial [Niabella sp.]